MKIPNQIDVLGLKIKIKQTDKAIFIDQTEVEGYADFTNSLIVLSKNYDTKQVLLHELFHVVLRRLGVQRAGITPEIEEIIVDAIATFINEKFDFKFKN